MDAKHLTQLLEGTIKGLGYELVDLELGNPRGGGLIRVFMDRTQGVGVEDCAEVSHHLARLLAVEGVDYSRLEVSSPGLDRPLRRSEDFRRFIGQRAQVRMRLPVDGRKNFTGILYSASESVLELEVEGCIVQLELAHINKARLVPSL